MVKLSAFARAGRGVLGRAFVAKVILAVAIMASFQAGQALAQVNWFTIWGYGVDMWTGTANNYHYSPWCVTNCVYDYMIPLNAEVRQDAQGSFTWEVFELANGQVFPSGNYPYAFKGHLSVYSGSTLIADPVAFMCEEVRTYGSLAVGSLPSQSQTGHWDQDSGASGGNCFTAYDYTDKWVVTGQ